MKDSSVLAGPCTEIAGDRDDPPGSIPRADGSRRAAGARGRAVPLVIAAGVVVSGILYYFFYDRVFRHSNTWTESVDLWGTFRAAHYVGWGYLGGIYNQETGMVSFPGMAVILAPVAMVSDMFHLSSSIGQLILPHPTAALILVPVILALASTVVIAADSLAFELGATRGRRAVVCVVIGILAWATTIVWGHPEDALVMTFACYAMVAVQRDNWRRAAWLFGVAITLQPLVALALPLFVASSPRARRLVFALRCSVLPAFLVGVAFLGNPTGTYRALVRQPTPPLLNHATPWVSLAPHVLLPGSGSTVGTGIRQSA